MENVNGHHHQSLKTVLLMLNFTENELKQQFFPKVLLNVAFYGKSIWSLS